MKKGPVLSRNEGFTFLELMLVIIILGVLAALISGNFITSLKKGRDARRKADLEQIRQALEFYYEDNKSYPPTADVVFGYPLCIPAATCATKTYMTKIPNDPITGKNYEYQQISSGKSYKLFTCLENSQQILPYQSSGYLATTMTNCGDCKYGAGTAKCIWGISSSNISP